MATITEIGGKVQEVIVLSSSDEDLELPEEKSKAELMKRLNLNAADEKFKSSIVLKENSQSSDLHVPSPKMETNEVILEPGDGNNPPKDVVDKFVSSLHGMMNEDEKKILNVIYGLRDKCQPAYLNSKEFEHLIDKTLNKAQSDPKNVFVYIKDVYDEMKAYSLKAKLKCQNGSASVTRNVQGNSEPSTSKLENEGEKSNEKQVRRLEKLLGRLDRKIRRLKRKEISLDEMDDNCSAYIYEDKLAKRFVKVWRTLCQLKKRSPKLGNHQEKKFRFEGSRYPELNVQIEKFLNTTRIFPDFSDICKVVKDTNETSAFGLSETGLHDLAKEVFEDVAKELRSRRQKDNQELFGCYLTDEVDSQKDPAEDDPLLKETLTESYKQGQQTLDQLLSKYTEQQHTLKLEAEEVVDEEILAASDQDDNEEDREIEREQILDEEEGEDQAVDSAHDDDDCAKSLSSSEDSNLSLIFQEDNVSVSAHQPEQPLISENCTSVNDNHESEALTEIRIVNILSLANSKNIRKSVDSDVSFSDNSKVTSENMLSTKTETIETTKDKPIYHPAKKIRIDSEACSSRSGVLENSEPIVIELE